MNNIDAIVTPRSLHNDTGGALGPSLLPWPAVLLRCSYGHALRALGADGPAAQLVHATRPLPLRRELALRPTGKGADDAESLMPLE